MSKEVSNDKKKKITIGIVILLAVLVVLLLILLNNNEQYQVNFDSNGGSAVASIIIDEDGFAVRPEDPTKENYVFAGWYCNGEPFDFSSPITEDVKLEARWVEIGRVSGVKLDKTTLTLEIGDTAKLNATVTPDNAKDKQVTWASSDASVISVDSKGNVKALKAGTATITVTTKDGEFVAEAVITVNKLVEKEPEDTNKKPTTPEKEPEKEPEKPVEQTVKVTGVTLDKTSLNLEINDSAKLTVAVKPDNATNKNVTWASSDASVASVDQNGNVKALKAGTATITVTTKDGSHKATCTVTVNAEVEDVKVTGVTLDKTSLSLEIDDSAKLTATVKPDNATNKNVTWSSSDASVASVDQKGNVKALKAGTTTITVTTKDGNYKATCTITVKKADSYVVTLTPESLMEGVVAQYKVTVTKNGSACTFKHVIYNGQKLGKYADAGKVATAVSTATVRLSDGTDVTATVVFK